MLNAQINEPLAPEGIEQAKEAVSRIPESILHIYTSPLLRTRQTAEILNSQLNRPVVVRNDLTEINMGTIAGRSWKEMENGMELKQKHRSMQFDYHKQGGESIEDVKKRIMGFLREMSSKHKDHEVLIVTHGGIIRLLHLLEHKEPLMENLGHIEIKLLDVDKIVENQ